MIVMLAAHHGPNILTVVLYTRPFLLQVYGEATLVFPLLVAETFARVYREPPVFQPAPNASHTESSRDSSQ